MKTVRSGDIVSDLAKPFDYYFFWLAQDLGANVVHLIVRGVPIMLAYAARHAAGVAGGCERGARLCAQPAAGDADQLCLAVLRQHHRAVDGGRAGLCPPGLHGGHVFFRLFGAGDVLSAVAADDGVWTPFPSIIEMPVQIWLGILAGPAATAALIQQAFWLGVLMLLGRLMLAAGTRKLVIQGG